MRGSLSRRVFIIVGLLAMVAGALAPSALADGPSLSVYAGGETTFNPLGDGQNSTETIYYCLSKSANVTITVQDAEGDTIRTLAAGVAAVELLLRRFDHVGRA